jgi:hypothetical protein
MKTIEKPGGQAQVCPAGRNSPKSNAGREPPHIASAILARLGASGYQMKEE